MGAILGPIPRSGKHGAIAFSRTAARCHNVTKTEVDSSKVPGTRPRLSAFAERSGDRAVAIKNGTAVLIREVGTVTFGPDIREGVAEWQGQGETVGGIIVTRDGMNALTVINGIKQKLEESKPGSRFYLPYCTVAYIGIKRPYPSAAEIWDHPPGLGNSSAF